MQYILMHEDIPVCIVSYYKENDVLDMLEIINAEHLPTALLAYMDDEKLSSLSAPLTKWAVHRTIPSGRPCFDKICSEYGFCSRLHMALKTGGASLTDHYWFKKQESDATYEDINFFKQPYEDTVFIKLLTGEDIPKQLLLSPGFMTNGIMPKIWVHNPKGDYLLKAGSAPEYEEPLNEYLAYKLIKDSCAIPVVKTSLCRINEKILCSKTESFTKDQYEFVPACDVTGREIKTEKALYDALLTFAAKNGIADYDKFLQSMLIADFLISNKDRHLGNFGFLRDASTLKIIGPAPLFDNGTSLLKQDKHDRHRNIKNDDLTHSLAKPFSFTWDKQIRYIKQPYFDMKAFREALHINLKENPKLLYHPERKEYLEQLVCKNIHHLDKHFEKIKENDLER